MMKVEVKRDLVGNIIEVAVKTEDMAGPIRIRWEPTAGGYETGWLDCVFGEGKGHEAFIRILEETK